MAASSSWGATPMRDDFFVSEEIECRFPDVDLKVHIGAYDISERIHREIQPLRANVLRGGVRTCGPRGSSTR